MVFRIHIWEAQKAAFMLPKTRKSTQNKAFGFSTRIHNTDTQARKALSQATLQLGRTNEPKAVQQFGSATEPNPKPFSQAVLGLLDTPAPKTAYAATDQPDCSPSAYSGGAHLLAHRGILYFRIRIPKPLRECLGVPNTGAALEPLNGEKHYQRLYVWP